MFPLCLKVCSVNYGKGVCRGEGEGEADRGCDDRWVIPRADFAEDTYPPYCNGPIYALNNAYIRQVGQVTSGDHMRLN